VPEKKQNQKPNAFDFYLNMQIDQRPAAANQAIGHWMVASWPIPIPSTKKKFPSINFFFFHLSPFFDFLRCFFFLFLDVVSIEESTIWGVQISIQQFLHTTNTALLGVK